MGCPVKRAKSHSAERYQPLTLPASGRMSSSVRKRESGQHTAASTLEKKARSPHGTLIFGTSESAIAEATHFRSHETPFSSCFLCVKSSWKNALALPADDVCFELISCVCVCVCVCVYALYRRTCSCLSISGTKIKDFCCWRMLQKFLA